jgi:hypothetical protein
VFAKKRNAEALNAKAAAKRQAWHEVGIVAISNKVGAFWFRYPISIEY